MKPDVLFDNQKINNLDSSFQNQESADFQEGRQWLTPHSSYLNLDACTQTRLQEDQSLIKKYGKLMFEGHWNWFEIGEPIVLFWDEHKKQLYCGDGHHRLKAARSQYLHQIYVEIRFGTLADAQIYNCTSNGSHGKRTTNQDKRHQIEILLKSLNCLPAEDSRRRWSDREIARRIGVDNKTVGKVRRELLDPVKAAQIREKKVVNGKNKRFYSFRKLICECNQQELINYLKQVDEANLSKLKMVMEQVL